MYKSKWTTVELLPNHRIEEINTNNSVFLGFFYEINNDSKFYRTNLYGVSIFLDIITFSIHRNLGEYWQAKYNLLKCISQTKQK